MANRSISFSTSNRKDENEGVQEHQIAANITLPHEGGWGWVVVASSMIMIFILDGVAFTFGSLLIYIAYDLNQSQTLISLVNSTANALYFFASPMASALINRFGFRICAMTGSIICSFSLLASYFAIEYSYFLFFYGFCCGIGYALINMSTSLVVGFYFEKLRSIVMAISATGSSFGCMVMFPANSYLVSLSGWRSTTLLHSGLFGVAYFLSMTFRPLLSVEVRNVDDGSAGMVVYLPSAATMVSRASSRRASVVSGANVAPHAAERLFGASANVKYPTAAEAIGGVTMTTTSDTGPSTSEGMAARLSKITLTAYSPDGILTEKCHKRVLSISSNKYSIDVPSTRSEDPETHRKSISQRIWEPQHTAQRPLYRDDAFYLGNLKDLQQYQDKSGLDYHLAVTRTMTVHDMEERRGVFTTAIRRVLATMMDPHLLKSQCYVLMCISGFCIYMGFLVPYVYLKDRNIIEGMDPQQCTLSLSIMSGANAIGRLAVGYAGGKLNPINVYAFAAIAAGISTMASIFSYTPTYQFTYCCIYGFFISSVPCLRSIILVYLFGLDKLTNATGMMLIFLGTGNLFSTPLAAMLKDKSGSYNVPFVTAGGFITMGGILMIFVKIVSIKELKKTGGRSKLTKEKKEKQNKRATKKKEKQNKQEKETNLAILDAERMKKSVKTKKNRNK